MNWTKLPSPLSSELWRCLLSVSESSNLHKKVAIALLRLTQDQGRDTFQTGSTILHLLLTSNQGQRLRIAPLEVSTKIKLKFSSPSWVFDVIYVEGILIAGFEANVGSVTTVPTFSHGLQLWEALAANKWCIMFEIVQNRNMLKHLTDTWSVSLKTFFSRETYWKVLKQNRIYIVSFSVLWWKLHFKFLDWKWLKFPLKAPVNFHYFQVLVLQTFL